MVRYHLSETDTGPQLDLKNTAQQIFLYVSGALCGPLLLLGLLAMLGDPSIGLVLLGCGLLSLGFGRVFGTIQLVPNQIRFDNTSGTIHLTEKGTEAALSYAELESFQVVRVTRQNSATVVMHLRDGDQWSLGQFTRPSDAEAFCATLEQGVKRELAGPASTLGGDFRVDAADTRTRITWIQHDTPSSMLGPLSAVMGFSLLLVGIGQALTLVLGGLLMLLLLVMLGRFFVHRGRPYTLTISSDSIELEGPQRFQMDRASVSRALMLISTTRAETGLRLSSAADVPLYHRIYTNQVSMSDVQDIRRLTSNKNLLPLQNRPQLDSLTLKRLVTEALERHPPHASIDAATSLRHPVPTQELS